MLNIKDLVYKKLKTFTDKSFNDSSNIFELGIDSLDLVELISDAEAELKITMSDEALESIQTVGDVVKNLQTAKNETK